MKQKLKAFFPLLLAVSLLFGCSTVDLPTDVITVTSNQTTSTTATSEQSSEPSSEISSLPSSVVETSAPSSSKASSAPSSTPVSSVPQKTSSAPVSSAPPKASSTPASSAPVSSAPPVSSTPVSSTPQVDYSNEMQTEMADIEDDILRLVNELRTSLGVHTLTKNSLLKSSAFIRSKEIALNDFFSHTRPNGLDFYTSIDAVGYPYTYVAENLAKAEGLTRQEYAQSLFNGWKNSTSHYEAMISSKTVETGISLYEYDGKIYGTQHFGIKK